MYISIFCTLFLTKIEAQNSYKKIISPKKAAVMSTIIPGLGQTYNKKFWKIPVIYAGLLTSIYYINDNQKKYELYKNAFIIRTDDNSNTIDRFVGLYSNNDLIILKDFYRRNREISILSCALVYILNIIDASVDAYLFDYDISEDLSLCINPMSNPIKNYTGISVSLNL